MQKTNTHKYYNNNNKIDIKRRCREDTLKKNDRLEYEDINVVVAGVLCCLVVGVVLVELNNDV